MDFSYLTRLDLLCSHRDDVWNEPGVVDLTDRLRDFTEVL